MSCSAVQRGRWVDTAMLPRRAKNTKNGTKRNPRSKEDASQANENRPDSGPVPKHETTKIRMHTKHARYDTSYIEKIKTFRHNRKKSTRHPTTTVVIVKISKRSDIPKTNRYFILQKKKSKKLYISKNRYDVQRK